MEYWACPKCGFRNDYSEGYCVSCNESRPAEGPPQELQSVAPEVAGEVAAEIAAPRAAKVATPRAAPRAAPRANQSAPPLAPVESSPLACEICRRKPAAPFSFQANVGMVFTRRVHSFNGWLCRTCAKGKFREFQGRNLAWGWFGLISFAATFAYAFGNLANYNKNRRGLAAPLATDTAQEAKLAGRPVILRALPGLAVVAAIIAVVVVMGTLEAQKAADRPYIDDFIRVNAIRGEIIELANSHTGEWTAKSDGSFPGPEYLCADEFENLLDDVEHITAPPSDELRRLHGAWLAGLRRLAAAERLLVTEPTEANFQADNQAAEAEYAAYIALFDYCKGRY